MLRQTNSSVSLHPQRAGLRGMRTDNRVIAGIAFSADCETLTLSYADNGGIVHTYFGN